MRVTATLPTLDLPAVEQAFIELEQLITRSIPVTMERHIAYRKLREARAWVRKAMPDKPKE